MTLKGGRPKFTPTLAQRARVGELTACGFPQNAIAQKIINEGTGTPIALKTLRRAFREELDDGKAMACAEVANALFKKAIGNGPQAVTAAIFWLKTQAGWKETFYHENTEPEPIDIDRIRNKLMYGINPAGPSSAALNDASADDNDESAAEVRRMLVAPSQFGLRQDKSKVT